LKIDRRDFVRRSGTFLVMTSAAAAAWDHVLAGTPDASPNYRLTDHWWAMAIDIERCIGCGNCVRACKVENDVPPEPFYFRTWVERYHVPGGDIEHPVVDSPNGGHAGFPERYLPGDGAKNFFVPKMCNHCTHSPCTQVCPVGAAFDAPDGVVLVDKRYCLG
jgi:Fe-S-cluster-containing dehydrogenase component